MQTIGEADPVEQTILQCSSCNAHNQPHRKFCAKCGNPLAEPCLECGEICSAAENFCGACGANLAESADEHQEVLERDFAAAVQMRSECRFDDAIALLTPITQMDHPRLAQHVRQAKQMVRKLTAERDRRRVEAEDAFQRARKCVDAFDYDGAALAIAEVPPAFHHAVAEELREQIASRRQEINVLTEELREAVVEKRIADLPARIDQLLGLKPDHVLANRLAEQMQTRLARAAEKHLANHQYDEARNLLAQIDPHIRTPLSRELHQRATELACLAWDLRNAPVIDKTLLAVAERMRRLAPDDVQAAKLCQELQRRGKTANGRPHLEPPAWARPPEETTLGVPVDWLTGLRRVACAAGVEQSDLSQHPGRFAVACGLALAGIKQAALPINLLSNGRRDIFRRVAHLMHSRSVRPAWGIDIGASGLKAVKLVWDEAAQQAVIEAAAVVEHAKSLRYAANEIEEGKLVADTLKTFLGRHDPRSERVCVGLPGRMVLSRQIELPPVDRSKAQKHVLFEASRQFPFPLDQLVWDFQFLDRGPADAPLKEGCRALLIAAKRATSQRLMDVFHQSKLRVDILQADFVALHNVLAHEYFAAPGGEPSHEPSPVVAALDVGCDVTNIVVSSPGSLWHRNLGVAGHSFTRALVTESQLSAAKAEQLKQAPESAERFSDLYESLSPVFDDFLREVEESLAAYALAEPAHPIQRVLGLGGGFSMHGLLRYLRCGR
jgi:type IV pilus assembly protein PilM